MNQHEFQTYLAANWIKTSLREPVHEFPFGDSRRLLAELGHPQLGPEFVGVTGSKGKGSIAALTAATLQAHGLRVGLFTSPHLERVEERIVLQGKSIDAEELASRFGATLDIRERLDLKRLGVTPLLLAVALSFFRDNQCDASVLEVRAGGRFDPTSVVNARTVCIGPIGLEHVPGLGYTIAEIAWQKAGLIKPAATCFSAEQPREAWPVLEAECSKLGARLHRVGSELGAAVRAHTAGGQLIDLRTLGGHFEAVPLALLGRHQAENAALAASAAEAILRRRGRALEREKLADALSHAVWPARLERLSEQPLVLYDGAHTPESAGALCQALQDHFPGQRFALVLGILIGKRGESILRQLAPIASRAWFVPIEGFSFQAPDNLARVGRALGLESVAAESLEAALTAAMAGPEPICVTGSLYLYAATRSALPRHGA
jgi:dihydrofolate synthase / folylpolyglutamate synthase